MGSQIELGHAMLTFIEPHPDGLVEYNRWYEHDHAYTAVDTWSRSPFIRPASTRAGVIAKL